MTWSWLSFWWGVALCWIGFTLVPLVLWGAAAWRDRQHRKRAVNRVLEFKSR